MTPVYTTLLYATYSVQNLNGNFETYAKYL